MRIAIIGAGFTGLTAGYELAKAGHFVEIWEKETKVGGMAIGFKGSDWDWSLEKFYHHIFSNDDEIIRLAKELSVKVVFKRPITATFIKGEIKQLDSLSSLLSFSPLSFYGRVRMGLGLGILKLIPHGQFLEKWRVVDCLPWLIGKEGYQLIWEKLLLAKFGKFISEVNMAWFWARVYKRTPDLGYFAGGFQALAEAIASAIIKKGGQINCGKGIESLKKVNNGWQVNDQVYDRVLVTTPGPVMENFLGEKKEGKPTNYLWGQTLVIETNQKLMNPYWLNILEKDSPFLVAVEHTNFMDKQNYSDKHIVYLGNYLMDGDDRLKMTVEELLELYLPVLKKINSKFQKKEIENTWLFQVPFAQPVFTINYSKQIPSIKTNQKGIYRANLAMVYPWDRGTNYAVEIGRRAAKIILEDD